jgi:hypothetical protein
VSSRRRQPLAVIHYAEVLVHDEQHMEH